uniref:Putative secreted peptide n=1 Tax=Anopheles braziliensis TaxID=58242 RepID=A0A2M3ZSR3_9DIPT
MRFREYRLHIHHATMAMWLLLLGGQIPCVGPITDHRTGRWRRCKERHLLWWLWRPHSRMVGMTSMQHHMVRPSCVRIVVASAATIGRYVGSSAT